jgi:hypothetical protein
MDEFELFRFNHHDGSSKDWAIRDNRNGTFTTRWGKTGSRLPGEKTKPVRHSREVVDLTNSKLHKGYIHVGTVFMDSDGNLQNQPRTTQFEAAQGLPIKPKSGNRSGAVYWDVKIDGQLVSQARQALGSQILTIAGQIKSVGSFKLPPGWDGWAKLAGFADEKGPTDMNAPDGLSGQVRKRHGIVPLLFLMALRDAKLEGVNIGLAGDDGLELFDLKSEEFVFDLFGTSLNAVRPLAEALGLIQPKIDLSTMAGDDFFF